MVGGRWLAVGVRWTAFVCCRFGCWLLLVGCLSFVVGGCWFAVVCCLLCVVGCVWCCGFVFGVWCLVFEVCRLSVVDC